MSIERSGAASSSKTTAGVEGQSAGKNKVKSGAEADATAAGGFFAILTSLEPQSEPVDAVDTALTDEESAKEATLATSDPLIPRTPSLPIDLAMMLEQAGKVANSKLGTVSDELPAGGAKGGKRSVASVAGGEQSDISSTVSISLGADKALDAKQNLNALFDQMAQGVPVQNHKSRGAELQADATSLAESRASKLSSLLDVAAREPALSGALATSGMGDPFLRQADKALAKSSTLSSGYGVEGAWGQHTLQAESRVDAPPVMADPSTLSLESMVADTVSYWVTQGVQNAQLKLDGFGGESVEVSISLKGDEAHIGFRTDQPELRQILEGAVAHLKDLLTSEGLVLSGVSVGTSGQDGTGAQEQRHRPGARQATVVTADTVPTESPQRVNSSAGREIDLFV
ncbi:MAG: flagellar hook-length control protein FliK [Rhodoferax sp.]